MSVYRNFICDFPGRCNRILSDFEYRAVFQGLEVTTMLAIASAGLIIPYERLKKCDHPSSDRAYFETAADRLDEFGRKDFLNDFLFGFNGTWRYGEISEAIGAVEWWKENTAPLTEMEKWIITGELERKRKTDYFLNCLRNALAHGNIFTPGSKEIKDIVFLSRINYNRNEYSVLIVSPSDFQMFLKKWFEFVGGLEMPEGVVWEHHEVSVDVDYAV